MKLFLSACDGPAAVSCGDGVAGCLEWPPLPPLEAFFCSHNTQAASRSCRGAASHLWRKNRREPSGSEMSDGISDPSPQAHPEAAKDIKSHSLHPTCIPAKDIIVTHGHACVSRVNMPVAPPRWWHHLFQQVRNTESIDWLTPDSPRWH